jgi:hypothetical protein
MDPSKRPTDPASDIERIKAALAEAEKDRFALNATIESLHEDLAKKVS